MPRLSDDILVTVGAAQWNYLKTASIGLALATDCKGLPAMFEALLKTLNEHPRVTHRPQGVAFLGAAKDLYGLADIGYACTDIPILQGGHRHSHCVYTSAFMSQWVSSQAIGAGCELAVDPAEGDEQTADPATGVTIVLKVPQYVGEAALLGMQPSAGDAEDNDALRRQLRILGGYFHEHILRLHGHQSDQQILLSARELDCLKWTAEGKTAWEASVILGITERTVRFHLNAAREKLNCTTTTQAVAKAVRHNMIEL